MCLAAVRLESMKPAFRVRHVNHNAIKYGTEMLLRTLGIKRLRTLDCEVGRNLSFSACDLQVNMGCFLCTPSFWTLNLWRLRVLPFALRMETWPHSSILASFQWQSQSLFYNFRGVALVLSKTQSMHFKHCGVYGLVTRSP